MFDRPDYTYDYSPDLINKVLNQPNNPLKVISELIEDGSRILDIGTGNGILADILKHKLTRIIIDGIEVNEFAGKLSRPKYRKFYQGDVRKLFKIFQDEQYDYIILADIIEHMANPYLFLKKLVNITSEDTKIILTVPNIAFGSVRISLLNGDFEYSDSGILEKTHLRFFNIKTLKQMLEKLEICIELMINLQKNYFKTEINLIKYKLELTNFLKLKRDVYSSTYQFLVVLNKQQGEYQEIFIGPSTGLKDYLSFRLKKMRIF